MLTEERQRLIIERINEQDIIKSRDLMEQLDVSESTIRRDLKEMEEAGLLKRVHGGAKRIMKLEVEATMMEKTFINVQEKKKIAEYAASLVKDGDFIYLDAGTTTYEMLSFLKGKEIHVITNSVYHASTAIDYGIPVISIGGTIRDKTKAAVGQVSIEQLKQHYFDKAFMGVNGIHLAYGYTTANTEEAATKTVAMEQAQSVFMLTDHSKFSKINFAKIADISAATIITNRLSADILQKITEATTVKEVY